MRFELPIVWTSHDATSTGRLELDRGRLTLVAKERTYSFRLVDIARFDIERRPERRLRGLPVLALRLASGDVVEIASLGGAGSLHELAVTVGARHAAASGT
jgi:hypothetical protein